MCLAIPGEVLSIEGEEALYRCGRVSFGGIVKRISLALTPEAVVGDYVLAHAGVAIGVINPEEAQRTFDYLDELAALEELTETPDEIPS
ncbi:MAG: HypC/HybG/HupF family hydrogenase formation chaperone [Candidatus Hydrogenedentes bacterium]|nr:HypC/HybG/HupF family hydrogenase formation chaperone [Candidatus Hydrogenedentota bacterium]MBI3118227.1 HypC/HybG/HupF family hydrogenase formation chaperone [Candidatus Hydrogenedentota bacterium]